MIDIAFVKGRLLLFLDIVCLIMLFFLTHLFVHITVIVTWQSTIITITFL